MMNQISANIIANIISIIGQSLDKSIPTSPNEKTIASPKPAQTYFVHAIIGDKHACKMSPKHIRNKNELLNIRKKQEMVDFLFFFMYFFLS